VWSGVLTRTEKFDGAFLFIILIVLILVLLAVWGFVVFMMIRKGKRELPAPVEPDMEAKEEDELEKLLHDLPVDQPAPEPEYNSYDFEPTPEGESQVSDLFSEEELPLQEEPLPKEEPLPEQGPAEEVPFAEQPIETLKAGEVIQ
jgi:hypothetical protein